MSLTNFRPWGLIRWLLSHLPGRNWTFVGCVGTEERCLTSWEELSASKCLGDCLFLLVNDRPSRHSPQVLKRHENNIQRLVVQSGEAAKIKPVDLFCSHSEIVDTIDQLVSNGPTSIVVDISVFPKRFFFPIIKRVLFNADKRNIKDIVITYTIPKAYPEGVPLAENFDDWAHLPLFGIHSDESPAERLVVGVGFQALGLHSHLKGASGLELKLLLPFPAPPAAFIRSWDLLRQIEQGGAPELFTRYRAGARDPSDTFDQLVALRNSSEKKLALAPFGPKPMSLGMCLFACLANCEVFYTQPSVYHPDYTIGVSSRNGVPEVFAYAVRIGGRNLYAL